MTQTELAMFAGLSLNTVRRWEDDGTVEATRFMLFGMLVLQDEQRARDERLGLPRIKALLWPGALPKMGAHNAQH